jgi:hypothetical protein
MMLQGCITYDLDFTGVPQKSAVQLGRGDAVHMQADMANPAKCRDSLQRVRQLKRVVTTQKPSLLHN